MLNCGILNTFLAIYTALLGMSGSGGKVRGESANEQIKQVEQLSQEQKSKIGR